MSDQPLPGDSAMICKIDHSDPDNVPAFLCQTCNPPTRRPVKEPAPLYDVDPIKPCTPGRVKHYQGLKRPRCNGGRGCPPCWDKYNAAKGRPTTTRDTEIQL